MINFLMVCLGIIIYLMVGSIIVGFRHWAKPFQPDHSMSLNEIFVVCSIFWPLFVLYTLVTELPNTFSRILTHLEKKVKK